MRLHEVLVVLRRLADESLAEDWDQTGLHAGNQRQDIRRALLCIDLTPAVLREAVARRATLIVAYHPPIFTPLARLTEDEWKGRMLGEVVRRRMALYSPHTALDAAAGGMNDWWCDVLGAGPRCAIKPAVATAPLNHGGDSPTHYKIITFVPALGPAVEKVRRALSAAGAGAIGAYTQCSFTTAGEGTFLGGDAANPAVGSKGRLERVAELRLEMVCPADKWAAVRRALVAAHPYEEPAYDVYPLRNEPLGSAVKAVTAQSAPEQPTVGAGRIVILDQPVTLEALATLVQRRTKAKALRVVRPAGWSRSQRVRRIGICVGAGGSLLADAQAVARAWSGAPLDLFLTGEMRHHDMVDAAQCGTALILPGHTETERPYLPEYRRRILANGGRGVEWIVSRADVAPGG